MVMLVRPLDPLPELQETVTDPPGHFRRSAIPVRINFHSGATIPGYFAGDDPCKGNSGVNLNSEWIYLMSLVVSVVA